MDLKIQKIWHSFFLIDFFGKKIIIDPFFGNNLPDSFSLSQKCPISYKDLPKLDLVLISHEHFDHYDKEAVEYICKRDSAIIVAAQNVMQNLSIEERCRRTVKRDDSLKAKNIEIKVLKAQHPQSFYPMGYLIKYNGISIYHAGDTYLINLNINPDIALLPCGGTYTMDIFDCIAMARKINPKILIPMHYNTFPMINADIDKLKERAEEKLKNTKVIVLDNLEEYIYSKK